MLCIRTQTENSETMKMTCQASQQCSNVFKYARRQHQRVFIAHKCIGDGVNMVWTCCATADSANSYCCCNKTHIGPTLMLQHVTITLRASLTNTEMKHTWHSGIALVINRVWVQYPPGQSCITTLGKLFTPMCLCHQVV